jgi:hypothetical protein
MGVWSRQRFLPVLLIGAASIPVWYGENEFWGSNSWCAALLSGLIFISGWCTREKVWVTFLVMMSPTMFIGGAYHGHPWQWLLNGLRTPALPRYFAQNMTLLTVACLALISIGRLARRLAMVIGF